MSETELTLAEAARRSQETFRARERDRSMVSERGPYLTSVTVAGNRLSDLIDALKQMDPDLCIVTGEVCRNDVAVLAYSVLSTLPPHRL